VEQFRLKGIDALLAAAHRIPDLRLVFLWRGMHFETLKRRVAERRVTRQVDILNEWVDVNAVLAHMHAAVVLAQHARVVKAYPHSLMESLAAGKPVLVSRAIPMSDYVQANGCGDVVDRVDADDVVRAIGALRADYERRRAQAVARGPSDFSQERVVAACAEIYARVLR
jgi:glycosyltransferase involved in cell wall biosynthesis